MFIELPNETRVNTDHIISYWISQNERDEYVLRLILEEYGLDQIPFDTEDEAKLAIYALDRAVGVKSLIIRK